MPTPEILAYREATLHGALFPVPCGMQIFWPDKPCEGTEMGEVRVKVKLTNAFDEDLFHTGRLEPEQVRSYEGEALVNTHAVRTAIPSRVIEDLGLAKRNVIAHEYVDTQRVAVGTSEAVVIDILGRDTIEDALISGHEIVIGRTVLAKLDLFIDCARNRVIPNPAHPDQPVSKVK